MPAESFRVLGSVLRFSGFEDVGIEARDFGRMYDCVMGEIFHYTDANALINILRNRTLWATHILHLNDPNEYTKPRETADRIAREIKIPMKAASHRGLSYVVCFSRKEDDLNQFRSYADDGKGYCVCFEEDRIKEIMELNEFMYSRMELKEIIYGEKNYDEYLRDVICAEKEKFDADIAKYVKEQRPFTSGSGRLLSFVYSPDIKIDLAIHCCKSGSYSDEAELRLVVPVFQETYGGPGNSHLTPNYRARSGRIIPYIELKSKRLPLLHEKQHMPLPIKKIIIGPAHNQNSIEILKDSLRQLCLDSGYHDGEIQVVPSNIDYRSSR